MMFSRPVRLCIGLFVVLALGIGGYIAGIALGLYGNYQGMGTIEGRALPAEVINQRRAAQVAAAAKQKVNARGQILFGDMHVHTTFSTDAFLWTLPIQRGTGLHSLADACDYARYCSAIDFWGISDHAEASTPRIWQDTKQSIRQCNEISKNTTDQDVVSFIGFEWTQVGATPEEHYGHKNVFFKDLDDAQLPARPIASAGVATRVIRDSAGVLPIAVPLLDFSNRQIYYDFMKFMDGARAVPPCAQNTPSDQLGTQCYETAATPADLARKLIDEQKLNPLIIPHGTTWGFYTPANASLDKQLHPAMRPESQPMIEVMSGHGNSEEYRNWRATIGTTQDPVCPAPSANYMPSCWRAGEIIRARCLKAGDSAQTCEESAKQARHNYVNVGIAGHLTVPGIEFEEWLNSGQCQDCFVPSFNYRPGGSVQYGLAISNFAKGENTPTRFRWGFIASSDTHRARPGTGYKDYQRLLTTEANGARDAVWAERLKPKFKDAALDNSEKLPRSIALPRSYFRDNPSFGVTESERQSTFWLTGGLAAVHAQKRTREAIWDAMKQRNTYGTSGARILLWFDLVNHGRQNLPMGSEVTMAKNPTFTVKAVGSFVQNPGCPDFVEQGGVSSQRLESLCGGECYNPSDTRHKITRIEIIRIRPQAAAMEKVEKLIEDPWLVHTCPDNANGCSFTFTDKQYNATGRDTLYYARAVQEETPTTNADNLRCEYDAKGQCIAVNPCYGDYRTSGEDACLAPSSERAWSSPIYVNTPKGTSAAQ